MKRAVLLALTLLILGGCSNDATTPQHVRPPAVRRALVDPSKLGSRVPPLLDKNNVYAADAPNRLSPVVRHFRSLVYVPNSQSNTVDEIDPRTGRVVRHFAVGAQPQHVVPAYDLKRLWVNNDVGNSLTPIDPRNGRPGRPVHVRDPCN